VFVMISGEVLDPAASHGGRSVFATLSFATRRGADQHGVEEMGYEVG
jgi:hypothetical protein